MSVMSSTLDAPTRTRPLDPELSTGARPSRAAYLTAASIVGLALFASGTPSPLYGVYSSLWGFSTAILTVVYATYALGALTTLLLAGRVSDEVGRRPVLLVALGGIGISTVLYMLARSAVWLIAARGLQGVATGLALSTASAALLDLHPRQDPVLSGRTNGIASAGGIGVGILVSSLLVQCLPAPRVLPYALQGALLLAVALATLRLPEPARRPRPPARLQLTPQRPTVPAETRRAFMLAALAVASSWTINGLFLSLGPDLAGDLLHTGSVLASGAVVASLSGTAAIAMLLFGRADPWLSASRGSLVLAAGMGLMITAAASDSGALFIVATLVAGPGFGITFLGGLRSLSAAIPAAHRAGVMSAFYLTAYGALSLPAIGAGLLVTPLGLRPTFAYFGGAVALLALVVAAQAHLARPAPSRQPA
jgi:MFS family permease